MSLFFNLSINHNIKIYLINIIIFLVSIVGIYKLNVENSFINYFKQNTEIYKGMKLIDQELGGTTPLDIIIKFEENKIPKIDENFLSDEETDVDLELNDDFLVDNSTKSNWFTEDKIFTIKSIHKYLEEKKEIGKVQSIYSLINLAEQINKAPLSAFELSILYEISLSGYLIFL